jgi:hypothetical protein
MAAVAAMGCKSIRTIHQRLLAAGRSASVALTAAMRKLADREGLKRRSTHQPSARSSA